MSRMKSPCYAFLFVLLFCWQSAHAQEPSSRWTLGAEVGLSIDHRQVRDSMIDNTWNSVQLGNLTADYRLLRWLSLRSEANFLLHNRRTAQRYINYIAGDALLLQWSSTTPMWGLTVGPQLLLRAGQGDFAFDFLVGGVYHRSRIKGTNIAGQIYDFRFRGTISPMVKLGLSYTYWPTKRFGINFGGEMVRFSFTRKFSSDNPPEARVDLTEQYPDTPVRLLQSMSSDFTSTRAFHLTLGVAYRL